MNITELAEFINYDGVFNYLIKYHEDDLSIHSDIYEYRELMHFSHIKDQFFFKLVESECEISNRQISFVYERNLNNGTESSPSEIESYCITYDMVLEEFVTVDRQ